MDFTIGGLEAQTMEDSFIRSGTTMIAIVNRVSCEVDPIFRTTRAVG